MHSYYCWCLSLMLSFYGFKISALFGKCAGVLKCLRDWTIICKFFWNYSSYSTSLSYILAEDFRVKGVTDFATRKQQKLNKKPTNNRVYYRLVRYCRNQIRYIENVEYCFLVLVKLVSNRSFPSWGNACFRYCSGVKCDLLFVL